VPSCLASYVLGNASEKVERMDHLTETPASPSAQLVPVDQEGLHITSAGIISIPQDQSPSLKADEPLALSTTIIE